MKLKNTIILLAFTLLISSCNFFKKDEPLDQAKLICFLAIDKGDTAMLKIDTTAHEMRGLLTINFGGIKKYSGQVKGVVRGDTLKGHFDFTVNGVDKWYRNPISLINNDGKLTMGVGEFVMIWGSPHFNPKIPIDYTKGRFVFNRINCN